MNSRLLKIDEMDRFVNSNFGTNANYLKYRKMIKSKYGPLFSGFSSGSTVAFIIVNVTPLIVQAFSLTTVVVTISNNSSIGGVQFNLNGVITTRSFIQTDATVLVNADNLEPGIYRVILTDGTGNTTEYALPFTVPNEIQAVLPVTATTGVPFTLIATLLESDTIASGNLVQTLPPFSTVPLTGFPVVGPVVTLPNTTVATANVYTLSLVGETGTMSSSDTISVLTPLLQYPDIKLPNGGLVQTFTTGSLSTYSITLNAQNIGSNWLMSMKCDNTSNANQICWVEVSNSANLTVPIGNAGVLGMQFYFSSNAYLVAASSGQSIGSATPFASYGSVDKNTIMTLRWDGVAFSVKKDTGAYVDYTTQFLSVINPTAEMYMHVTVVNFSANTKTSTVTMTSTP